MREKSIFIIDICIFYDNIFINKKKGENSMIGINDILEKVICREQLIEEDRFKILRSKIIDPKVVEYLMEKLNNLYIEVLGDYEGSLFELMHACKLNRWCWQTTESAIVFLNDDDYIERGDLKFGEVTPKYYHSWICFKYDGVEYVLDPCLNFLCKKDDYSKIFEADVKGRVTAKDVKEELIRQITSPKKEDNSMTGKSIESFLKQYLSDSYGKYKKEEKKNEVIVDGPKNVNTPLYRNGAGYRAEFTDGKIKKLTVHYYYCDC